MRSISVTEKRRTANPIIRNSPQQRVLIAKDVIKWLRIGRLCAISDACSYVASDEVDLYVSHTAPKPADARELVRNAKCDVCAKGAILVSMVDRFDVLQVRPGRELADYADDSPYMRRLFPDKDLIEVAFEGWRNSPRKDGVPWESLIHDATVRLAAIMHQIIRNKGGRFDITALPSLANIERARRLVYPVAVAAKGK